MQQLNQALKGEGVSFRERSSWLSLITIVLAFGYYFVGVLTSDGSYDTSLAVKLVAAVFVFVLVRATAQWILAAVFVRDAVAKPTEVDRRADLLAHKVAYYVLVSGVFAVLALMLASSIVPVGSFRLTNIVLFFFVLAELGKYATMLVSYRRARPPSGPRSMTDAEASG